MSEQPVNVIRKGPINKPPRHQSYVPMLRRDPATSNADELAQFLRVKTLYRVEATILHWKPFSPSVASVRTSSQRWRPESEDRAKARRFVTVCIASSPLLVLAQTGRYGRGFAGPERQSAHRPQRTSAVLRTQQCRPRIHLTRPKAQPSSARLQRQQAG